MPFSWPRKQQKKTNLVQGVPIFRFRSPFLTAAGRGQTDGPLELPLSRVATLAMKNHTPRFNILRSPSLTRTLQRAKVRHTKPIIIIRAPVPRWRRWRWRPHQQRFESNRHRHHLNSKIHYHGHFHYGESVALRLLVSSRGQVYADRDALRSAFHVHFSWVLNGACGASVNLYLVSKGGRLGCLTYLCWHHK